MFKTVPAGILTLVVVVVDEACARPPNHAIEETMSAAVNSDPKILRDERFETVLISWAVVMG
jgi:hypothetical protein